MTHPPSDPGVGIKEGGTRPAVFRLNQRIGRPPDFVTEDGLRVWVESRADYVTACASYGDRPLPPSFLHRTPRVFESQGAALGEVRAARRVEWRWWPPRWRVLSAEQVIERLIDDVITLARRRARERAAMADGVARVISHAIERRRDGARPEPETPSDG